MSENVRENATSVNEDTVPGPEASEASASTSSAREPLLKVRGLTTAFKQNGKMVPIVEDIDFNLYPNEALAIVGESGCGKSVTSLSIMRLIQSPGKIMDGSVELEGRDLLQLSEEEMRSVRGNKVSMIFQEPMTSLNPVFTVGSQVMESFQIHQHLSKSEAREKTIEMLRLVGIPAPETVFKEYPHELSGGLRQRVMIAMALACRPRVLIADEPTTALDVTIQAQILRLLRDLMDETGTATILITHDLGVVAQVATYVMVMYAGQAVEYGSVSQIIEDPLHPYTLGLLQCLPRLHEKVDRLFSIKGAVPSPDSYPAGCRFCPRCDRACERCATERPPLMELADGRRVRCWLYADTEGAVRVPADSEKEAEQA